ncbi:shikimate dehydrogenase [Clostridium sp. AM58-1XD]|uniref:shikimate dehydrogenase n=1 Tax=Clostridium sp. AM58-1XD TaxID=2292307 RepID=UPI000E557EAD|nr:shikimate dehydrogenase [Clostridium sp. AM58-1XD]RGY99933.1 shikimate dehydrogenase [Clostridium sp. AM58-1XD]
MGSEITAHTKMACILGSPVGHSLSPVMYNKSFELLGIDCRYLAFDTTDENIGVILDGLVAMDVIGFNVTMPIKKKCLNFCDEVSRVASLAGAVNTVVNKNGRLIGYATDGIGFMEACRENGFPAEGEKITVFGTGGAGMSIFVQAAFSGAREISVFSRDTTRIKERELIRRLNEETSCKAALYSYEDKKAMAEELAGSRILVNTTSVGMYPDDEQCLVEDQSMFHSDLAVFDIVYSPMETKLLQMAKKAGCMTANGVELLIYQGAAAFKIWTGQDMPVKAVRRELTDYLGTMEAEEAENGNRAG